MLCVMQHKVLVVLLLCSTRNSDYNYDQDSGTYNNDEEDRAHKDTTEYFNYQSRMEKTPRVRWTKQDTELFYEVHFLFLAHKCTRMTKFLRLLHKRNKTYYSPREPN